MIGYPPRYLPMSCFRGSSLVVKATYVIGVLSSIFFQFAVCGPCIFGGIQEPRETNDACRSLVGDSGTSLPNAISDSFISGGGVGENSKKHINLGGNAGRNHDTEEATEDYTSKVIDPLPVGYGLSNSSWSSDNGMSKLLNGRALSCSLTSIQDAERLSFVPATGTNQNDLSSCRGGPLYNQRGVTYMQKDKFGSFDGSLSPHVEIDPPVLDWGERYLYVPSFASLTVSNNCNDSILHVYQPFSTDSQFFPCNFTEAFLGPGEAASICFVFLPKQMGLSSSHLILQTNSGGFLVKAKGFATEFPYGQQPLLGFDKSSSSGRWRQNLSLFNPFDETISVQELALWVFASVGNTSIGMEATCSLHDPDGSYDFPSIKDWFLVRSNDPDSSLMALQPHRNWEIRPQSTETIVEIDFSFGSVGKIFGAFCMQLMRPSQDRADIIMVPVEAEIDGSAAGGDFTDLLTISLETMGSDVAVSLRNSGSYVVRVVRITEVHEHFQVKSMEGLLLFPATVTRIALVTCSDLADVAHISSPRTSDMNCKLVVQTNGSRSRIEIPCEDIVYLCTRHQDSFNPHQYVASGNKRTKSFDAGLKSPSYGKELESATQEEQAVLHNWKSQGTNIDISVLEHNEVIFPVIQVGSHFSKWITVRNPSQNPVIVQLILNSGERIDGCRAHTADAVQLLSSASLVHRDSANPSKYGFSISRNSQTEAYLHPNDTAYLGPIVFHPSNRCEWRSSALIRNSLSGVEWFSLQGRGGSYALELLENAESVQNLEFNLDVPDSLNSSSIPCSVPLKKEVYAKNIGDLPLEVRKIKVSGTDCGLDGFAVQNCSRFTLDPGESTVLRVNYKSNFFSSMVRGDLELALASGIIVVPMKAAVPLYLLELCKKSSVWVRVKEVLGVLILVASLICFVILFFFHQGTKNESISVTIAAGPRSNKVSATTPRVAPFHNSVGKDKILGLDSVGNTDYLKGSQQTQPPRTEDSRNSASLAENNQERVLLSSSQIGNLKVDTGKDKGRKRRKRKGGTAGAAVLNGLIEVSSSQSGNSTPSSPLSPASSATPRRGCPLSPDVSSHKKSEEQSKEKTSSAKNPNKPMLLPSATFPCSGRGRPSPSSQYLVPTATIAPHARAPGSKLYHEKAANLKEKTDEFTYDIWGANHFSVLHMMGRSRDDSAVESRAMNSYDSESFFVRGPQTLMMTKFQPESVSCSQAG